MLKQSPVTTDVAVSDEAHLVSEIFGIGRNAGKVDDEKFPDHADLVDNAGLEVDGLLQG